METNDMRIKGKPKEHCIVCNSPDVHCKDYNKPTVRCIQILRK